MDALPQWTSKVEKRGLDPLGMQNSGVVLYQALLPGISNITLRMRYYGFFCWLSDVYARRGVTTEFEIWRQWVRRAEALYALICADATGDGGVGGIDWALRRLQLGEEIIDFAAAASTDKNVTRYLIQNLGVFGAAYYTQMKEMGLFEEGPNGIQRVSGNAGLAAGVHSAHRSDPKLKPCSLQRSMLLRSIGPHWQPCTPWCPRRFPILRTSERCTRTRFSPPARRSWRPTKAAAPA